MCSRPLRYCGYILESARGKRQEKKFLFHGFKMEPNTDKLCLALHTACQTRYQKVLESHPKAQRGARDRSEVCVYTYVWFVCVCVSALMHVKKARVLRSKGGKVQGSVYLCLTASGVIERIIFQAMYILNMVY